MTPLAALAFLGSVTVILMMAGAASWVLSRRTTVSVPDPLVRAGASTADDPATAARRAGGATAWMRPDGGGF